MAAHLDIPLQRNEDWARTLLVEAEGQAIDLTSMTVALQVRDKLTQALIASAECDLTDPANGEVTVLLRGSSFDAYGNAIQVANLPYDLRVTESDSFHTILFAGQVILSRGETV